MAQLSANEVLGLQLVCFRREICPQGLVIACASKSSGEAEGATTEVLLSLSEWPSANLDFDPYAVASLL